MGIIRGIQYNIRGVLFSLKRPKLLALGCVRFGIVLGITILLTSLVLLFHQEILNSIWTKPQSQWVLWVWHLLSWLLSFFLIGLASILSFLVSQILFSVFIMDLMSLVTERIVTGHEEKPHGMSVLQHFFFLAKQEIPRTTIPVTTALILFFLGWLTPFGPLLSIFSSGVAIIFLAWDNTDLVPARQLYLFKDRFKILLKTIPFHLGFGLPFLIPWLNILFLSFAPVGGTLYNIDAQKSKV